jgi:tetratricopeptide (TPR) repeat protein
MTSDLVAKEFFYKGKSLYKQKEYSAANKYYLKAIEAKPDYENALYAYAQNLRLNIKDYKEAIKFYTKVVELNPNHQYALFQRGICKGYLEDYSGQIEDYSKVIELEPNPADYVSRALIKKKINNHVGVIIDCTHAISLESEYFSAYQYRGEARMALSDYKGAIEDLERAIAIEEAASKTRGDNRPMTFGTLKHCGIAKALNNDVHGALEVFQKLIAQHPDHPLPYKLSAKAKEKLGDMEGYKEDYQKFKLLNESVRTKSGVSFEDQGLF